MTTIVVGGTGMPAMNKTYSSGPKTLPRHTSGVIGRVEEIWSPHITKKVHGRLSSLKATGIH